MKSPNSSNASITSKKGKPKDLLVGVAAGASTILRGDGSFSFIAHVEGDDIVVDNVNCTWFGGLNDPQDNGETASGINTKTHPKTKGCSLPMDGFHHPKTDGSPIPKLPWQTSVCVTNSRTGKSISVPLIDLGPSKMGASHAAIDLTPEAFKALGGDLVDGVLKVSYRIPGGGKMIVGARISSVSLNSLRRIGRGLLIEENGHGSSNVLPKPEIISSHRSPNYSSRNGTPISMVVLHCTEGSLTGAINEFLNPAGRRVSAHYVVDRNGDVYQMVRDTDRANHCKGANEGSIGIEHVAGQSDRLAPAQEASSLALIRWLQAQYMVKPNMIFGHDFAPGYSGGGTSCPDKLFGSEHSQNSIVAWLNANALNV